MTTILSNPDTPEARKLASEEDSPACENSTGAYYKIRQILKLIVGKKTYIKHTVDTRQL